jgi:hypothetical protein
MRPRCPLSLSLAAALLAVCSPAPTPLPTHAPDLIPAAPPSSSPTPPSDPIAQSLTPSPNPSATQSLGPTVRGRVENLVEVGHAALDSRGWNAGLALAHPCAYVGNRRASHIAIVDVSDPARPAPAGALAAAPPSGRPVELRAVPDLHLLVVLNFAPALSVLTYDVRDCRDPQPLGAFDLGAVPHEFFLWRDPARPARLLMYVAMFNHTQPDLHVLDLTDPAAPRRVATWTAADEGGIGTLHSLSLSRDGRRAYLALWEGGFVVADASELADDAPDPRLRLVRDADGFAPAPGRNVHSAALLSDPRYVLVTQEVYACPFAGLFLADISNESHPQIVSRFDLPENDPACAALPQAEAVFTAHNPLVVGDLAFVTWYGGGLQALDLSDPAQPRRVGLFVPRGEGAAPQSYVGAYPVQTWSYPILREGLIYVSDIQSGLYVLRYTGPGADALGRIPLAEGNATIWP